MSNLTSNNPFVEDPELLSIRAKGSSFVDLLQTIVTSLVMVIVIYLFIVTPTEVKGMSMRETVQDKDLLISNKLVEVFGGKSSPLYFLFGDYKRGDIVVFHESTSNVDLIKRVIGISGDKLRIQDGYVYVNGTMLNETYLADGSINPAFTYRETKLLDDIRVIDMYNDTILNDVKPEERVGHWTDEYFNIKDIEKVIETQFGKMDRIFDIIEKMKTV